MKRKQFKSPALRELCSILTAVETNTHDSERPAWCNQLQNIQRKSFLSLLIWRTDNWTGEVTDAQYQRVKLSFCCVCVCRCAHGISSHECGRSTTHSWTGKIASWNSNLVTKMIVVVWWAVKRRHDWAIPCEHTARVSAGPKIHFLPHLTMTGKSENFQAANITSRPNETVFCIKLSLRRWQY